MTTTASRRISSPDKNALWVESRGVCAFPRCGRQLVVIEGGARVTLGEIAHIRAHSPGGPRYDPKLSDTDVDRFENLVLLCGDHHKAIDARPSVYTVGVISAWKESGDHSVNSASMRSLFHAARPVAATNYVERDVATFSDRTVVTGIAGSGKTQLCLQYARTLEAAFDWVWWIRCESDETMLADLADLASMTGVSRDAHSKDRAIAQAVTHALNQMQSWVLIFDGALDERQIENYVPESGKVLVTTQSQGWGKRWTQLGLDRMRRAESLDLLTALIPGPAAPTDVDMLATFCADNPLMLRQAASYITATGMTLTAYVELMRTHRPRLLERGFASGHQSLASAIDANLTELSGESSTMINALAMLASDPITILDPISQEDEGMPGWLSDALMREDALASLRQRSLATRLGRVIQLHELIADRVLVSLTETDRAIASVNALAILLRIIPGDIDWHKEHHAFDLTLPHLLKLNENVSGILAGDLVRAAVSMRLGSFYARQREYEQAERLLQDSYAILKRLNLADQTLLLASVLHNLGELYFRQRKVDEAEDLVRHALQLKLANSAAPQALGITQFFLADILHARNVHDDAEALTTSAIKNFIASGDNMRATQASLDMAERFVLSNVRLAEAST